MDENGYMMGIGKSSKVVFSKYQKQTFIKQALNQERDNWYIWSTITLIYYFGG